MAIITIDLSACRTRAQLAAGLNVPPAALDLVTLTSKPCRRSNGCPLTAALSSYGCCFLCSQTWFPRKFADSGEPAKNHRGHGLYGRKVRGGRPPGEGACGEDGQARTSAGSAGRHAEKAWGTGDRAAGPQGCRPSPGPGEQSARSWRPGGVATARDQGGGRDGDCAGPGMREGRRGVNGPPAEPRRTGGSCGGDVDVVIDIDVNVSIGEGCGRGSGTQKSAGAGARTGAGAGMASAATD